MAFLAGAQGEAKDLYVRVSTAFKAGLLEGTQPTYNGFWRHLSNARSRSPSPEQHRLPAPREASPAYQELLAAEREMNTAAGVLNRHGLFEDLAVQHRFLLKTAKRGKSLPESVMRSVASRYAAQTELYREKLRVHGIDEPGSADPGSSALVPAKGGPPPNGVAGEAIPPVMADPEALPRYRDPVGVLKESKTSADAKLRMRIVAPVLNGVLTVAQAAQAIREIALGLPCTVETKGEVTVDDLYGFLKAGDLTRYRRFRARTIQRWLERINKQKAEAAVAVAVVPAIVVILQHRTSPAIRAPRKATPQVEEVARQLYKENPHWSMAGVARHMRDHAGISISDRTIQTLLAETISDVERAHARGGDEADLIFRAYLYRDVREGNHTWIGDASYLKHERLVPGFDPRTGPKDFDFECDVAIEHRNRFGTWKRDRGQLHISLWTDAASRYVVGLRAWAGAPTTLQTIATLFDAVRLHGVPYCIYTDNGSDYKSKDLQSLVTAAGIQHAFSRPYTPQGRGIIERMFGTIKEMVMPYIPGFYSHRHDRRWAVEDLLSLEELEAEIWNRVDQQLNYRVHSETRRKPAEHYAALVGARALNGMIGSEEPARFLELLPREVRAYQSFGVELDGMQYWPERFGIIPIGTQVFVHYEPTRWRHVYLSVVDPKGTLRYLGRGTAYDHESPPPEALEVRAQEAEWRDHIVVQFESWAAARDERRLIASATTEGLAIAQELASAVGEELQSLSSGRPPLLLLPGETSSVADVERPPAPVSRPLALPSTTVSSRPRRNSAEVIVNPLE